MNQPLFELDDIQTTGPATPWRLHLGTDTTGSDEQDETPQHDEPEQAAA